jgi:hypothetical protein
MELPMEYSVPAWVGDWKARIRERLARHGYTSLHDFMTQNPGRPYEVLTDSLGSDLAPIQLIWMQLEDAVREDNLRWAAMDALARELTHHLRTGWVCDLPIPQDNEPADTGVTQPNQDEGHRRHRFQTAGVFASWSTQIELVDNDAASALAAVWNALNSLHPPIGWLPSGPDDPLIVAAFAQGWPEGKSSR